METSLPDFYRVTDNVLEQVEKTVLRRIEALREGPEHYGLIYADMRFANLFVDDTPTRLIDLTTAVSLAFIRFRRRNQFYGRPSTDP